MRCKLLAAVLLAAPALALAAEEHGDPVAPILGALALILVAAKLGADVAMRLEQPAVLGELVAGVIVGNLDLVGFEALRWIRTDPGWTSSPASASWSSCSRWGSNRPSGRWPASASPPSSSRRSTS